MIETTSNDASNEIPRAVFTGAPSSIGVSKALFPRRDLKAWYKNPRRKPSRRVSSNLSGVNFLAFEASVWVTWHDDLDFVYHEDYEGHEGFGNFILKLRDLRTTIADNLRGLRKFSGLRRPIGFGYASRQGAKTLSDRPKACHPERMRVI